MFDLIDTAACTPTYLSVPLRSMSQVLVAYEMEGSENLPAARGDETMNLFHKI